MESSKKKIVIVCSGNTCRSPVFAAGLKYKLRLKEKYHLYEVESAAVGITGDGEILPGCRINDYLRGALPKIKEELLNAESELSDSDIQSSVEEFINELERHESRNLTEVELPVWKVVALNDSNHSLIRETLKVNEDHFESEGYFTNDNAWDTVQEIKKKVEDEKRIMTSDEIQEAQNAYYEQFVELMGKVRKFAETL
jgi:protein-tyrosine-phosphatase